MTPFLLQHHRRLFLRGLQVQARIGIHDFEQQAPQRLIIDVDLYVSLADTQVSNDQLDEVVDYDFVRRHHDRAAGPPRRAGGTGVHPQARCVPRLRCGRRGNFSRQAWRVVRH